MRVPHILLTCCLAGLLAACAHGSSGEVQDRAPRVAALGARGQVDEADLEGQHFQTVEEMLRGRIPGLHVITLPNGNLAFRIRGQDSLVPDTGRAPLVVIDGMAVSSADVGRTLRFLSPSQIARITVLRDVSSTSIYGVRGANGVILIETKLD